MPQGPRDPSGGVFGVPRLEPRPRASLKLFDDARSDAGVNVGAGGLGRGGRVMESPSVWNWKLSPCAKRACVFGRRGTKSKHRGRAVKDGRSGGAPGLHKRRGNGRLGGAREGSAAPILDGTGDAPLNHKHTVAVRHPLQAIRPQHKRAVRGVSPFLEENRSEAEPEVTRSPPWARCPVSLTCG